MKSFMSARLIGGLLFTLFALSSWGVQASSPVTYVSLSYDDALQSQLENAVPALNSHGFNASFYLVPTYPGFIANKKRWAGLSELGHELGNHSYTHPCRGSLPDRAWVDAGNDLDSLTVADMKNQIVKANTVLHQLDGAEARTYTIPCGDIKANGESYLDAITPYVFAVKGKTLSAEQEVILAPSDISGKGLVDFVKEQPETVRIINIIFHGVGGDYLSVSNDAHAALLDYLHDNRARYQVDTYINIVKKVREGGHQ